MTGDKGRAGIPPSQLPLPCQLSYLLRYHAPLYSFNSARPRAYAVYSYRLTQFAVLEEKKPRLSAAALHPSSSLPTLPLSRSPAAAAHLRPHFSVIKAPLAGCGLRQPHAFSHAGSTLHADLCANLVREIAASQAGDRGGGLGLCDRNRCTMPHATSCNNTLNSVA